MRGEIWLKTLIYTIICFKCIMQITDGSPYQKYIKLFSYLLTLCICCNMLFSLVGQIDDSFRDADRLYSEWEKEWERITDVTSDEDDIKTGSKYYEERLWNIYGEDNGENEGGD